MAYFFECEACGYRGHEFIHPLDPLGQEPNMPEDCYLCPSTNQFIQWWHYSNGYEKRERFIKQILWGKSAGLGKEIEDKLGQLSPDEWVEYGSKPFLKEIDKPIYYVTGRMGSMSHGFGAHLTSLGRPYTGRELDANFFRMRHEEQVETILNDLYEFEGSPIAANSYGAFLFLEGPQRFAWFLKVMDHRT